MIADLSKLCLHTITTKPWAIEVAVPKYAAAGVKGITVWRNAIEGRDLAKAQKLIADHGLTVVSLCRGGFFPSPDAAERQRAIDDNKRAIDEAAALGAPHVVLVPGSHPRQPLTVSRAQIRDGIAAVLPHARAAGVKLAIEPLHPMYAGDRSAVNTLRQANDMCDELASPSVGVAVDVYHLWWDSELAQQIQRCGSAGYLFAFHLCDWKTPTLDFLNDRGLMGEGCINLPQIRGWVEAAGFRGFNEVEIFSDLHWAKNQDEFLREIIAAYERHA
ncbi:MAG: sugar phosphate isomerase/epimerase [Verrucomicrobiales bacterium]|jgi:sugar phosphate isomerase/epimerase|nr:sugar phosphate isomerase/epimerase [Verrucomicrobiales bacterium]